MDPIATVQSIISVIQKIKVKILSIQVKTNLYFYISIYSLLLSSFKISIILFFSYHKYSFMKCAKLNDYC